MQKYTVLGIESSCDETGAAVFTTDEGLLSNPLFSQIAMHHDFGGVVPEMASRLHMEKIDVIVAQALTDAGKTLDDIDVIAVTNKPGLPGSLMIGTSFAKALAYAKNKKLIGVNHLEGHAFSACIENKVAFPFLCLTASGGHTSMYVVHDFGTYETIASTLDDAAGEAFDKIAKMINLPYPGGPEIEKLARQVEFEDFFSYPRGQNKELQFSFSGLKTAVLYDLVKRGAYDLPSKTFLRPDDLFFKQKVSSSLLVCIKDIFVQQISLALKKYPQIKAVCFVGGVACNKYIRAQLDELCQKKNISLYYPTPKLCTDNAGMIAFVGHYKAQQGLFDGLDISIL